MDPAVIHVDVNIKKKLDRMEKQSRVVDAKEVA